jgi:branched-chain amino acid transport system substrate-binding protein
LTLTKPAPNVFRFVPDAAQGAAGLGRYAYRTLGWRTVVTIGDDAPYGWEAVSGFVAEFCALGGRVIEPLWPEFASDFPAVASRLPASADGVYLGTAFPPLGFLRRLAAEHADLGQHLVGNASMLFFPQTLHTAKGVVFGGQMPIEPLPAEEKYLATFKRAFPRLPVFSALDPLVFPYRDAVAAALDALERADGSSGPRFRAALSHLVLQSPTGSIHLDRNRQAVASAYLSRVGSDAKVRTLRIVPNVEQTYGGYFTPESPPRTRTLPACRKATPPPWAQ